MSSFRVRPRFTQAMPLRPDQARARLVDHASRPGTRCEVKTFPDFVCFRIPENERHFWSPRLNLSLNPGPDGGTLVHGTYGPNANVWSMFLYGYLLSGSLALFSGLFGFCQWSLGHRPWGLWIFGLTASLVAGLYLLAQIGQKLAAQQTFQLHQIFESAMGTCTDVN